MLGWPLEFRFMKDESAFIIKSANDADMKLVNVKVVLYTVYCQK